MSKYGESQHSGSTGKGNPSPDKAGHRGDTQVKHDTAGWSPKGGTNPQAAAAVTHASSKK